MNLALHVYFHLGTNSSGLMRLQGLHIKPAQGFDFCQRTGGTRLVNMKVLCLLLFCLSAVAALRLGFKRGFRYSYRYDGWVAHGIPDALEKDVALKIKAIVHLDYLMTGFEQMTLENVKLAKIIDKILYNDRLETNYGKGEALDGEVTKKLKACLEVPIKFQFKNGAVETEIITEENAREYCVNIQRAILNQLYLPITNNEETYQVRLNEVTVLGKCKTAYYIMAENPYYKVKRVVDLTKCTVRPEVFQISLPNTDAYYLKRVGRGTANELPIFTRREAYMHYDLQGDTRKGFIIAKVISENVEELTLNGDQYQAGKVVAAHSKQILTLIAKEETLPDSPKGFTAEKKRGGLLFVFDHDKTEIESVEGQKNILTQVRVHIATIKQHLKTGDIKLETATEFTRLVSMLRHCTVETLNKVVKDIIACSSVDVRRLLIDAMARIGTEAGGIVLKDVVTGSELKKELHRIMYGVGWVRGLDPGFIKQVLAICKHPVVVADIQVHRGCWLSLGVLTNRLMVEIRQNPRKGQDIRLVALKLLIAKTMKEGIQNTKDNEVKINYLKAVGNAGWTTQDVFKVVCDLITNVKTPLHVRVQAIWALRHMARVWPVMVRQKLLPILANPFCDPELRISCYKILMQNDPSLLTCQMIAGVIAREAAGLGPRSNQLVSFIVSDLRTSINYDNIDIVKSSRARLLLRIIPRAVAFDMFSYAKAINIPIDAGNDVVVEVRAHKINVPQTFIPRHIHTKFKVNMPGVSSNMFEFGIRMQGIHDILQLFIGPKGNRPKRSLDILRYIFGVTTNSATEVRDERNRTQKKLPARVSAYIKMHGSEVLYSKMSEADLLEVIRDALFGDKTAKEGGCTFTAEDIKCNRPFVRAHLVSEKRYMIPTLIGIPLKYSGKFAAVVKGRMAVNITGLPQLFKDKFEEIQASVLVKPTVAVHMHQKVGVWLPIVETGMIVRHDLFSALKTKLILTVNPKGFKLEAPVTAADQQLLVLKPEVRGLKGEQVRAGVREWDEFDLQLMTRGFIDIPETCYGQNYINLMVCKTGRIVDREYLRLKRLPIFPYGWLNTWENIVLRSDETNPPTNFEASYDITTNTDAMYEGMGTMKIMDETKVQTEITMMPKCDKTKWTCTTEWTFNHKRCPATCSANMTIDYSQEKRLEINTKYGGDKELNHEVLVEDKGKTLHVVNTWNELPEWVHDYIHLHRPAFITFFHRFFGIKGAIGTKKLVDIKVKLFNKFVADIFVDTPKMKLRRINQALPIAINSFELKYKIEIIKRLYGACVVKGTNHIETTDNIIINEEIPSLCPFVLAEDARGAQGDWRILLRKAEGGGQILIAEVGPRIIEFGKDKTVKVDGKIIELKPGMNDVPGGKVAIIDNQLYYKADFGFECLFDGAITVVVFTPWWHNRIRGICGNKDGEQWTDFMTPRKTFMPEILAREFLREWVVDGKTCKLCKLVGKHLKLATDVPKDKICYTIGRFLRCMAPCTVGNKQKLEEVAYHCLHPKNPLIARIEADDPTVALEMKSIDALGPVVEHVACSCK